MAVRPGGEFGFIDDQAANRREGQRLDAVYHLDQLLALGHDLRRNAAEDRLAVGRDAAVDDDEMADTSGHAVDHEAGEEQRRARLGRLPPAARRRISTTRRSS